MKETLIFKCTESFHEACPKWGNDTTMSDCTDEGIPAVIQTVLEEMRKATKINGIVDIVSKTFIDEFAKENGFTIGEEE